MQLGLYKYLLGTEQLGQVTVVDAGPDELLPGDPAVAVHVHPLEDVLRPLLRGLELVNQSLHNTTFLLSVGIHTFTYISSMLCSKCIACCCISCPLCQLVNYRNIRLTDILLGCIRCGDTMSLISVVIISTWFGPIILQIDFTILVISLKSRERVHCCLLNTILESINNKS